MVHIELTTGAVGPVALAMRSFWVERDAGSEQVTLDLNQHGATVDDEDWPAVLDGVARSTLHQWQHDPGAFPWLIGRPDLAGLLASVRDTADYRLLQDGLAVARQLDLITFDDVAGSAEGLEPRLRTLEGGAIALPSGTGVQHFVPPIVVEEHGTDAAVELMRQNLLTEMTVVVDGGAPLVRSFLVRRPLLRGFLASTVSAGARAAWNKVRAHIGA